VRPDDKGRVISVTGKCPAYEIKGWIDAEEAKQPRWLFPQPPPCYFVPHNHLRPIQELMELSKELT
jgi:hypothetical protein